MAVSLSPLFVGYQVLNHSGLPNAGGFIYVYQAGTSTPATTYTDSSGTIANTNPIQLDAAGYIPDQIWVDPGSSYKFVVQDAAGNVLGTYDNIPGLGALDIGFTVSTTATPGTVARALVDRGVCVTDAPFNADPTGVAHSDTAFANALAASDLVIVPIGNYSFANGLAVPAGKELRGASMLATNPPTGVIMTFANSTSVCVSVYGNLNNVAVTRSGTPVATSVGVKYLGTNNGDLENVYSYNHGQPFYFNGSGVSAMCSRLFTGAVYDAHVVVDTQPEVRFSECRFGTNGGGDQNCNAYLRLTGGSTTNAAEGPNTVYATNCQFNQGQNTVGAFLQFANRTSGSIADNTDFRFSACHVESVNHILETDSTWTSIDRISFSDGTFNSNSDFFAVDPATQINDLDIHDTTGSYFNAGLGSSQQINQLKINYNTWLASANTSSVNVAQASTVEVTGNTFSDSLLVSGSLTGGTVKISGNQFLAGSFSASFASPYLSIEQPGWVGTWTPTLEFGSAASGITYSTQSGSYTIKDGWVEAEFQIVLTSKGTSTGVAQIVGLPINALGANPTGYGTFPVFYNMASMASPVVPQAQGNLVNLSEINSLGYTNLTDSNFTNTSQLTGFVRYRVL